MEEPVFMHSSCVLRKVSPEWVVYQEIYETNKMYMRGITAIEPEWLPKFAPTLCQLSEPLTDPPPRYFHGNYIMLFQFLFLSIKILITIIKCYNSFYDNFYKYFYFLSIYIIHL